MDEYKIVSIEEGLTKIEFPEYEKVSSAAPVFYNPHMELNRDLSILAIQVFQKDQDREINICDLFGGSGSTLIACENLKRKCRMMELDPHYCDVIIDRWQRLTGEKAEPSVKVFAYTFALPRGDKGYES